MAFGGDVPVGTPSTMATYTSKEQALWIEAEDAAWTAGSATRAPARIRPIEAGMLLLVGRRSGGCIKKSMSVQSLVFCGCQSRSFAILLSERHTYVISILQICDFPSTPDVEGIAFV